MAEATLAKHARAVLDIMVEQADADGLWTGKLTEVVASVGGTPHYSQVRKLLIRSGAAEQVYRGGGGVASRWQIINAEADIEATRVGATHVSDVDDRLDRIQKQIGGLDIPRALADLALEVKALRVLIVENNELRTGKNDSHPDKMGV